MQARADCEAKGAMLLCPETEAELTVVRNFLKTSEFSLILRFPCLILHKPVDDSQVKHKGSLEKYRTILLSPDV